MKKYICFTNTSTDCYINSVLQLLWNNEDLMNCIDEFADCIEGTIIPYPVELDHKVAVGLQILHSIAVVRKRFKESDRIKNTVNLIKFRRLMQKEFWSGTGGGQQDAHEFMNNLIDRIQTGFDFLGKSIIQEEYGAKTTGGISGHCGHVSTTKTNYDYYEIFLRPTDTIKNIQSLIKHEYYSTTLLTGESAWSCEKCGTKQDAVQVPARLVESPKNLILCIRRFEYDQVGTKISTPIIVDPEIVIPEGWCSITDEKKIKYQLTGLIVHLGSSLVYGHYISIVKDDDKWLVCNDTILTEADTLDDALKCSGGDIYLLSYRKSDY